MKALLRPWRYFEAWRRCPDYRQSDEYLAAIRWRDANPFGIADPKRNDPIISLARGRYEELIRSYQALTARADGFLKTELTILGLLAGLAKVVELDKAPASAISCYIISVILLMAASVVAGMAILPMPRSSVRSADSIVMSVNSLPAETEYGPWIIADYHVATVGLEFQGAWKGRQCARSAWLAITGTFLATISLAISLFS